MQKVTIIVLFLIILISTGCGSLYVRQWESQLWHAPNDTATETPEFG